MAGLFETVYCQMSKNERLKTVHIIMSFLNSNCDQNESKKGQFYESMSSKQ